MYLQEQIQRFYWFMVLLYSLLCNLLKIRLGLTLAFDVYHFLYMCCYIFRFCCLLKPIKHVKHNNYKVNLTYVVDKTGE